MEADGTGGHPDVVRLTTARPSRAADLVSRVADPAVLVTLTVLVVAVTSTPGVAPALGWVALTVLFCVGLPTVVLALLVAGGHVLDRHVVVREERRLPLLAALVSVGAGLGLLVALSAPRPLVALVAAMLAGAVPMTVVSHWYKASFHTGVAGGTAVVLTLVAGPWLLVLALPGLVVVGWARVRAGRHTTGQVVLGAVLGCAAAGLVFPFLA